MPSVRLRCRPCPRAHAHTPARLSRLPVASPLYRKNGIRYALLDPAKTASERGVRLHALKVPKNRRRHNHNAAADSSPCCSRSAGVRVRGGRRQGGLKLRKLQGANVPSEEEFIRITQRKHIGAICRIANFTCPSARKTRTA